MGWAVFGFLWTRAFSFSKVASSEMLMCIAVSGIWEEVPFDVPMVVRLKTQKPAAHKKILEKKDRTLTDS